MLPGKGDALMEARQDKRRPDFGATGMRFGPEGRLYVTAATGDVTARATEPCRLYAE